MDAYQDIRLLPDPEFAPRVLLNHLFDRLHLALVRINNREIGISFPEYDDNRLWLGQCLRLHGTASVLGPLEAMGWLGHMRDHVRVEPISNVPAGSPHRVVRRVQAKSNPERLRRRMMKRKGVTHAEALAAIPDSAARTLDLPYIAVSSHSTGRNFRLFVEHCRLRELPAGGSFNTYGLSDGATVPWF